MTGVRRHRDLLVIDDLVIATDTVGGIGPKPADTVIADARTVAHFALRVPLLEVICAGARPIAVIDALCVEMNPTGREMIAEVRALAAQAGVSADAVTGSTEDNVETRATGIAVSVIGRLLGSLEQRRGRPGDAVVCAGLPISAPRHRVHIGHPDQVGVAQVLAVVESGLAQDALPVGSKGLGWEVPQLAEVAGLDFEWLPHSIELDASGGPASCVLFAVAPVAIAQLRDSLGADCPLTEVARLRG